MNSIKRNIHWSIVLIWLLFSFSSCRQKQTNSDLAGSDEYYTCSMDPQVIENKAGNCPICHMRLIKVKRNNLKAGQIKLSAQQIKLGNISFDTISLRALAKEITLTGTVTIDQNLTEAISAKTQGRIEKLVVKSEGDIIYKGQILYEIYSEDLNSTQAEYLLSLLQPSSSTEFSDVLKNKLLLYGMNQSQINQIKLSQKILQSVPIIASEDGLVSEISISEGNYVSAGTTLFRLSSLKALWVEAQVYLPYLPFIKTGTVAKFSIPAASEKDFSGNVIFIDPQVQSPKRFVIARFQITDPVQQIKPGMLASIIIETEQKRTLVLPLDAIIQDSKGANVWVRNTDGVFENKMVVVGMQNSHDIEILDGLKAGDIVVVTGAYLLNSEYIFKKGTNPMEGHQGMSGMKM